MSFSLLFSLLSIYLFSRNTFSYHSPFYMVVFVTSFLVNPIVLSFLTYLSFLVLTVLHCAICPPVIPAFYIPLVSYASASPIPFVPSVPLVLSVPFILSVTSVLPIPLFLFLFSLFLALCSIISCSCSRLIRLIHTKLNVIPSF